MIDLLLIQRVVYCTMKFLITLLLCLHFCAVIRQDIPYRDESTYKLSLKMEFKFESAPNINKVDMVNKPNYNGASQMYLNASLKLLSLLDEDYKIRVVNNIGSVLVSKKLKSPDIFLVKLGFANHMKSQTSPNTFTIQFINKEKEITSQIILEIKENGDFMVNGKRFGKV